MGGKKSLRETYRLLIQAVYARWNADKLDDVPRLLDKYKNQEAEIYDRIVRIYVFSRPRKDWQPLIEAMYARFNPSKLTSLESIFAKYKDSEAALYRALCDKYLPTLHTDSEDKPLLFNVWGLPGHGKPEGSDGSSDKEDGNGEPQIQLASPSQERQPSAEDDQAGRSLPRRDDLEKRANQPGAAEEAIAAAEPAEAGPKDKKQKKEKKEKKEKKRKSGAEEGDQGKEERTEGEGEGRRRRRRRSPQQEPSNPQEHVSEPAPEEAAAYPPPLPRRRKRHREQMAGVMDVQSDAVPSAMEATKALLAEASSSREKLSKKADASLRPKAAPRPPRVEDEVAIPQVGEEPAAQKSEQPTVKRKRVKVSSTGQNGAAEGVDGRRRKKRRKVPAEDAAAQAAAGTKDGIEQQVTAPVNQDGQEPNAAVSSAVTSEATQEVALPQPEPSQVLASQLDPAKLEQRRQQLKDKLLALKTQISTQAKPTPPMAPPAAALPPPQPVRTIDVNIWKQDDASESEYSYSDSEEDHAAENRTVTLRNALEAKLRAQLLRSAGLHQAF